MTAELPEDANEADLIRRRLETLDRERQQLQARLDQLQQAKVASSRPKAIEPTVTNSSSALEKVALFRRLFAGRTDVFPIRWDNPKTGRSGYAPACTNEWVRGVCGKPQVKCGDCPNKAFIPVTAEVIECHLRGEDRIRPNGRDCALLELVARRSRARYVLGLSATVARKDGHHPIIFMHCGPVRYRVDAKSQAATRSFSHKVRLRETGFRPGPDQEAQGPLQMASLYAALAQGPEAQ